MVSEVRQQDGCDRDGIGEALEDDRTAVLEAEAVAERRARTGLDTPHRLVVTDVPAQVCQVCDEYWFDESIGFALSRLLQQHEPGPGEVRTVSWIEANAA